MVVGIWYGDSKPKLNEFIQPFVAEMESLLEDGTIINGHYIEVRFGLVICDTPARSIMKGLQLLLLN